MTSKRTATEEELQLYFNKEETSKIADEVLDLFRQGKEAEARRRYILHFATAKALKPSVAIVAVLANHIIELVIDEPHLLNHFGDEHRVARDYVFACAVFSGRIAHSDIGHEIIAHSGEILKKINSNLKDHDAEKHWDLIGRLAEFYVTIETFMNVADDHRLNPAARVEELAFQLGVLKTTVADMLKHLFDGDDERAWARYLLYLDHSEPGPTGVSNADNRATSTLRTLVASIILACQKNQINLSDIYEWPEITGAAWKLMNAGDHFPQQLIVEGDEFFESVPLKHRDFANEFLTIEERVASVPRSGYAKRIILSLGKTITRLAKMTTEMEKERGQADANHEPLEPHRIADLRRKTIAFWESAAGLALTEESLLNLRFPVQPMCKSISMAARIFNRAEVARLNLAHIYYMGSESNGVAARRAERGKKMEVVYRRVPNDYGMVAFAEPLSYPGDTNPPIHLITWGVWDATYAPVVDDENAHWAIFQYDDDGQPLPVTTFRPSAKINGWVQRTDLDPSPDVTADLNKNIWVTGYHSPDGKELECVMIGVIPLEVKMDERTPPFLQHLVACWDIITQERVSKSITEVDVIRRAPKDRRSDNRRGIVDDGKVRVVQLKGHTANPVDPDWKPEPGASGRTYRVRWWVDEFDRNHCSNPHLHKQGLPHHHEDIIVIGHARGPQGAPMITPSRERTVKHVGPR